MFEENAVYNSRIIDRIWLSENTFELKIERPDYFKFTSGQRVTFIIDQYQRDYSIVSSPENSDLRFCIRNIKSGRMSTYLSSCAVKTTLHFKGPHGYFTFKPSVRPPIFVATGTGIAPFCSMAHSGIRGFALLHGVRSPTELYYKTYLDTTAEKYIPCIEATAQSRFKYFKGRVTKYLQEYFSSGTYDFYLCGKREMIKDVILIVDDLFPGSYIYTEIYY